MSDTTSPQVELICDTTSGKTADGAPCVPVCSTTTRKYADSVPCEPVCDPTSLKYADSAPCEHADVMAAVDQVTGTTVDQVTTTTVGAVTPTGSLPVTGQSMDAGLLGAVVLLFGVLVLRISRRRPISR